MCHNKQCVFVCLCQNICNATQEFPGFSMPLLTYRNTYIQISASGIKFMHHSTSFLVSPISISGMNISKQKSGNTVQCLVRTASAVWKCTVIHVIQQLLTEMMNKPSSIVRFRGASLMRAGWSPLPPSVSSYLAPSAVWILYATLIFSFSTCSAAEPHSLEVGEGGRWTH